jgi:hypothetical protein
MIEIPPPFTLSADGRTLTWDGIRTGRITWSHDPTDDELQYAVDHEAQAGGMLNLPGQGHGIRRLKGNWFVYHAWGPPTWWLPRPSISWKRQAIGIGWLNHAFALTYITPKES